MKKILLPIAVVLLGLATSCKGDKPPVVPEPVAGKLTVKFENVAGSQALELGGTKYVNAHGDSFSVNMFKYYISNIVLINDKGEEFAEPESYHLINQSESSSLNFDIKEITKGTYTGVKLMIGVDSLRNVSGAQTGALDPMNGMFWTWNTGYIMAKFEGNSPQSGNPAGTVIMHLGGFNGEYNSVKSCSFTLNTPIVIDSNNPRTFVFQSNILSWFEGKNQIDFQTYYNVMLPGEQQKKVAENYAKMLTLKSAE